MNDAETLTDAQVAELRPQLQELGLDVRPLPTNWLERQAELRRRARRRAVLEQFCRDLHKITVRTIEAGLLTDSEVDVLCQVIATTGSRVSLERSAMQAMRRQ